jgi:hypothetical protein
MLHGSASTELLRMDVSLSAVPQTLSVSEAVLVEVLSKR